MTTHLKPVALGAFVVAMMFAADVPEARYKLGFFREAAAGLIIAPVATLPPGCAQVRLNNVDYMPCGSTYYRASMMGTHLVSVVALP